MSLLYFRCMSLLHFPAECLSAYPCQGCILRSCWMSLNCKLHVLVACPWRMSMLHVLPHVYAACPRRMSMTHIYAACPAACLCRVSTLHVHAACPWRISMLHVLAPLVTAEYHPSVEIWLHPWLTVKPVGCIVSPLYTVQSLYISCYVLLKKPVLSDLLFRLLPHLFPFSYPFAARSLKCRH